MSIQYFLYLRKSTEEEDRQVLSLEAQESELREFAQKEQLNITKVFKESKTAKEPGRSSFNEMLDEIEQGNAEGILAWHPDRLARNTVDGGRIVHLVDNGKIKKLKFPTFWFENTPQGKFMLNIAFGQSKYYVDNLSQNVKRGLRQKLRNGEWPGLAPLGYLNDQEENIIVKDPDKFHLVKKLFKLYATGNYTFEDLKEFANSSGLEGQEGGTPPTSTIQSVLENPFYYGMMRYKGELYEASHEPMVTKKLFDKVQEVMEEKSKSQERGTKNYPFRNLLECGECGYSITSQTQKGHVYYHCTKKGGPCSQPYIREEDLTEQINKIIQKVSLDSALADKMIKELNKQEQKEEQAESNFAQNLKNQIEEIDEKLENLLDLKLEETISKEEYNSKKKKLLNQKAEIEEKLENFEQKGDQWLERAKNFILSCKQAENIASGEDLARKKDFLKRIGLNRKLKDKKVSIEFKKPWEIPYQFNKERRKEKEKRKQKTASKTPQSEERPAWRGRPGLNRQPRA